MERALAYIRVSTDRQVKDGTSLVTQERRVQEYSSQKGYELDRLFVEEGETAKTDNRPVLQELLAYAKKNKGRLQVLVFPKIDRFARYSEDYHFLKRYLRNLGIRVESTDERFDDSPAGRFMENVLAAQAQYDNDLRSERCRGGMKEGVSQGRWVCGKAPIGFRNTRFRDKATIEPDPITGPIVAEAFERLAWKGCRVADVRAWLEENGVKIGRSHFCDFVRNKIYIGVIVAFGMERTGEPPILPIVSEATFYKAQLAIRPVKGPVVLQRDREDFPLRGTVKCPCGRVFTACWSKGRTKLFPYYRCVACPRMNLQRAHVHAVFQQQLKDVKRRLGYTPQLRRDLIVAWREESLAGEQRLGRIQKEVETLTELQRAIALKNAQGIVPDALAKEQLEELGQKIALLKSECFERREAGTDGQVVLDFADGFLTGLERHWIRADLASKKHIQRFFFPNGATVFRSPVRTPKKAHSTGVNPAFTARLSPSVDCAGENTNPGITDEDKLKEVILLLRRMHHEFGPPAAASSKWCERYSFRNIQHT